MSSRVLPAKPVSALLAMDDTLAILFDANEQWSKAVNLTKMGMLTDDDGVEQYLGCLGSAIFSSLDGRTPVSTKASSPSRLHATSLSIAISQSRFPPQRVPVYDPMYV